MGAVALGVMGSMAQGAGAGDIFAKLAEPAAAVEVEPSAREGVAPALRYVPGKSEAALALTDRGVRYMVSAMAAKLSDVRAEQLRSIGSVAVSVGEGGVEMLTELYRVGFALQSGEMMSGIGESWTDVAKEQYAPAIASELEREKEALTTQTLAALQKMRMAPVYVALSADAGSEPIFSQLCAEVKGRLASLTEQGWQKSEWQGMTGVRIPLKLLMANMLQGDEAALQALGERELHILTKEEDGTLQIIICEDTAALAQPTGEADSLLTSPALKRADAHLRSLVGAAWASPAFLNALVTVFDGSHATANAVEKIFSKLAELDAANGGAYLAAQQGLHMLSERLIPQLRDAVAPATYQMWEEENALCFEMSCDARGIRYEPGFLRFTAQADAPEIELYAETTALTVPYKFPMEGTLDALMATVRGITLSLVEPLQDEISPHLQMVESFGPDIVALGNAVSCVISGLEAPYAVLASEKNGTPDVVFCAEVKDRAALAAGWQMLLGTARSAAEKLGVAPEIVNMLPIATVPLGGSSVCYTLALPPHMTKGLQPQIALSDQTCVFGVSGSAVQLLTTAAEQGMPFCGAVIALKSPVYARTLISLPDQAPVCRPVQRGVDAVYGVSTVEGDSAVLRLRIETKRW